MDDDFPDFPELPDETDEAKSCINECDIYSFFNKLQSPWQQLLIDVRDSDKFKQSHPRYTINIPINTSLDDIYNILKKDIEAQQNIIGNMYIYADIDNDDTQQLCSIIITILKDKFAMFPQVFIFNDKDGMLTQKYPFLCEHEMNDEEKKEDDEKQEKDDPQTKYRKLLLSMAQNNGPKKKQKSFIELYSERIGYHLEYPDQILNDKLFLGDYNAASRKNILQNLGITHIVNCTKINNEFEKDKELNIKYFQIAINDEDHEPIGWYFEGAIKFIDNALNENENNKVFIHCAAGVSRSSTITIAYLMKSHSMSMDVAISYVQERRSCIDPNGGFKLQLQHFEKHGYKIDENTLKKELQHFGEELYVITEQ